MILDGAQGQTADEICEVLGYGAGEIDQVNEYCKSMLKQLPALDNKTTIKIANAILVDKSGELLDTYKKSVAGTSRTATTTLNTRSRTATVIIQPLPGLPLFWYLAWVSATARNGVGVSDY